ncbi:MAG: OmpA family protein [Alcanivorax sp.]|nr:OmpA family protein [Alcanivorax sp.]
MKKGTLLAVPLVLAISGQAGAHENGPAGYWIDSQGQPVMDRNGNCIRTGTWNADSKAPAGCGDQEFQSLRHISMAAGTTFEFDSARLKNKGRQQLDDIADKVGRLGDRVTAIEVDGFTDNSGPAQYNMNLSKQRARSVSDYLVSRGVDRDKIQTRGYGETHPVADNGSKAGRERNRRVEIRVRGNY